MAGKQNSNVDLHMEESAGILELLEFTIAERHFGINVAKVTEIMQRRPLTPVPNVNPYIIGIFEPRGKIVTVINLPMYLDLPEAEPNERDIFLITNFSHMNAAFFVHSVVGTQRIRWRDVEKPVTAEMGESVVTGTTQIEDRLVSIIDFEKVLFDINPSTGINVSDVDDLGERTGSDKPIVIAEDSVFLKKLILQSLEMAGYSNISAFENGYDAWEYLETAKKNGADHNIPIENMVSCVITDIEMPKMDGHQLTKLIKADAVLSKIPVIVFSSLVDEAQRVKGEYLGVSAHLSKPQIGDLVSTIDQWIL